MCALGLYVAALVKARRCFWCAYDLGRISHYIINST